MVARQKSGEISLYMSVPSPLRTALPSCASVKLQSSAESRPRSQSQTSTGQLKAFSVRIRVRRSNPGIIIYVSVPNIDLPALCAPRFKPGPPSEEAQVLSDRLASTINACVPTDRCPLS